MTLMLNSIRNLQNDFLEKFFEPFADSKVGWSPDLDVYETKDTLTIEAEILGMSPEDVEVTVENNILTIKGEKKEETKQYEVKYHRLERRYGSFSRSLLLPTTVDPDKISASCKNGVLKIEISKKEGSKIRKIEVGNRREKFLTAEGN